MARIERECLAEDFGLRKPTVKDKLKAAITNNYAGHNIAQAKLRQEQLVCKLVHDRLKCRNKKQRKRAIKEYRLRMDSRPLGETCF